MSAIEYLPLTPELARQLATAAEPGLTLPFGAELWAQAAAKGPGLNSPAAPPSACTRARSSAPAG